MNVVNGDPEVELPIRLKCRSMSVGDVYLEDGQAFLCASVGWEKLDALDAAEFTAMLPQGKVSVPACTLCQDSGYRPEPRGGDLEVACTCSR